MRRIPDLLSFESGELTRAFRCRSMSDRTRGLSGGTIFLDGLARASQSLRTTSLRSTQASKIHHGSAHRRVIELHRERRHHRCMPSSLAALETVPKQANKWWGPLCSSKRHIIFECVVCVLGCRKGKGKENGRKEKTNTAWGWTRASLNSSTYLFPKKSPTIPLCLG